MSKQFNILKGLGILLVVIGHVFMHGKIHNFIYLFHIPLFYFISGYFFKEKYIDNILGFIKKRFLRLYVPYIYWGVFFIALINLFVLWNLIDDSPITIVSGFKSAILLCLFKYIPPLSGAIWFLKSLFISNILFVFIRKISMLLNKKYSIHLTILISISLYIIGVMLQNHDIRFSMYSSLNRELCVTMFVCIGWFYHLYIEKRVRYNIGLLVISFILLVFFSYLYTFDIGAMSFNPLVVLFSAMIGCYFMLSCSYYMTYNSILCNCMSYIGTVTIQILALHFLSFKIVTAIAVLYYKLPISELALYPVIDKESILLRILYIIVGVGVPVVLTLYWNRLKKVICR